MTKFLEKLKKLLFFDPFWPNFLKNRVLSVLRFYNNLPSCKKKKKRKKERKKERKRK